MRALQTLRLLKRNEPVLRESAKSELPLDDMDHEALRKEVFAWYGSAAYYAQCIEVELIIARLFLARLRNPEVPPEELDRIDREKKTMGQLLKLVGADLKDDEAALLNACLENRNFLVHDYWYQRRESLLTVEGCQRAASELQEMSARLKQGNAVAEEMSRRIRARLGISDEMVHNLYAEFHDALRSGDSREVISDRLRAILQSPPRGAGSEHD